MPFDGSGNYSRVHDWTDDRDNGIKIQASRMDAEFDDMASALNQVFFRSGLVAMSGALNMGDNDLDNIKSGTADAPSVNFNDDPNTGMFLQGVGALGFTVNGDEVLRLVADATEPRAYIGGGPIQASSAALQVNGFTRQGSMFLHDMTDANTPDPAVSSELANNAGVLEWGGAPVAMSAALSNYVDLTSAQTISGRKDFTNTDMSLSGHIFNALPFAGTKAYQHAYPNGYVLTGPATQYEIRVANGVDTYDTFVLNGGGTALWRGSVIWTQGNDGPGSGLDADTVDGVQASNLGKLGSANTWTGINQFNAKTLHSGGTEAEFRDVGGRSGRIRAMNNEADYTDEMPGASTFGMVIEGTSAGHLILSVDGNTNEDSFGLFHSTDNGVTRNLLILANPTTFTFNGNKVFHAGNDGAGSTLDADLLDGLQGNAYAAVGSANTFTATQTFNALVNIGAGSTGVIFDMSSGSAFAIKRQGGIDSNTGIAIQQASQTRYIGLDVSGNFSVSNNANYDAADQFKVDMTNGEGYLGGNKKIYHSANITTGTAAPSGGSDGDIYMQYS